MSALPFSQDLIPGQQYTFEFLPNSIVDAVINNWALEARIAKDWGRYATIDKIRILGAIKITISPTTSGGTVASWVRSLKWSIDNHLFGDSTFVRATGGEGGYLGPVSDALNAAPKAASMIASTVLLGLLLVLAIQSGALAEG